MAKLIPVDVKLTEPLKIPYWQKPESPKYIDLKKLYVETKELLKLANKRFNEINKSQIQ